MRLMLVHQNTGLSIYKNFENKMLVHDPDGSAPRYFESLSEAIQYCDSLYISYQ